MRKNGYKNNINIRLKCNLRNRLRLAVKRGTKAGSAVRDLGCSIEEFKIHIEKQFYPHPITGEMMTWENYGKLWHFDHKKPLSIFDLTIREQLLEACHYTNIQPMWAEENIRKGNKI
jgi:hypothetical protein